MNQVNIKIMTPIDIKDVIKIQLECYTQVEPETENSLLLKVISSPNTCWIAQVDKITVGYLICHPWDCNSFPKLNAENFSLPEITDVFYIHDLAISKRGKSHGIGTTLVKNALEVAKKLYFREARLIAVQNSEIFWNRFGFVNFDFVTTEMNSYLKGYGDNALTMRRNL